MGYYITKVTDLTYEEAMEKSIALLKEQGFGIITEIDVKQTFKNKIDVDFRKYKILGACNPVFAHKALVAEDKIGVYLPCNVVVQELDNGNAEVFAVDPVAMMEGIKNPAMEEFANEVKERLNNVIQAL